MSWQEKQKEYEAKKSRTKLALNVCTICGKKAKGPCKGCGTAAYCSTECQKIDWRDRGHRAVCKKIQNERAAEAARAEAPPKEVFYGPAPRSHADEVRARIAAEHEAARARREANPEPVPLWERHGPRCPICFGGWDPNEPRGMQTCCMRQTCRNCTEKIGINPCPLCRTPVARSAAECLARLRRHADLPEALGQLGQAYLHGNLGLVKSAKKAAKLYKRAVELGDPDAMVNLAAMYCAGHGVKLDRKKATQLTRMAADRGYAIAQYNLSNFEGLSVEESLKYLQLAADQGLSLAERALGDRFERGDGVQRDLEEAKRWWDRAVTRGKNSGLFQMGDVPAERELVFDPFGRRL